MSCLLLLKALVSLSATAIFSAIMSRDRDREWWRWDEYEDEEEQEERDENERPQTGMAPNTTSED